MYAYLKPLRRCFFGKTLASWKDALFTLPGLHCSELSRGERQSKERQREIAIAQANSISRQGDSKTFAKAAIESMHECP